MSSLFTCHTLSCHGRFVGTPVPQIKDKLNKEDDEVRTWRGAERWASMQGAQ